MQYKMLKPGFTAPMFTEKTLTSPAYSFDTVGGRYILLGFFGTVGDAIGQAMWKQVQSHRALFNDAFLAFFGVTCDINDQKRLVEIYPGIRHFLDLNGTISREYGSFAHDPNIKNSSYLRQWVLLDPMMRVIVRIDRKADGSEMAQLLAEIKALPPVDKQVGFEIMAPILVLPRIFEPDFCDHLIALYNKNGGEKSGFMRQENGKTVGVHDLSHKSRTDYNLDDDSLKKTIQQQVTKKIVPQIQKAHNFQVTRMERYLVACYDAETGGHFRAHRDNTTSGTAHRRFAVSINLNEEFDGGEVGFPEYGSRTFKPPKGGAVVFSCSLLHHVTKVNSGKRFAFLPFLYDDAAAVIREKNNQFLAEDLTKYGEAA